MLVDMETKDGLKRRAIMVITKKLAWHMQTYSTIKLKIFFSLLCTPMVLIYNSELGIIICSDFFCAKKLQKKHYVLPSIFIYLFWQGVVGGHHMKYLGNFFFIFIYRLWL